MIVTRNEYDRCMRACDKLNRHMRDRDTALILTAHLVTHAEASHVAGMWMENSHISVNEYYRAMRACEIAESL